MEENLKIVKLWALLSLFFFFLEPAKSCTGKFSDLDALKNPPLAALEATHAFTPTVPVRGSVLLVHGLNLRPSKMNALKDFFLQEGYFVLRLSLKGHTGNLTDFTSVQSTEWISEVTKAYCYLHSLPITSQHPIHLVGFSLGALAPIVAMLQKDSPVVFEKKILLAPAISIYWYTHLVRPLAVLLGGSFIMPSASLAAYRSQAGTPLQAYRALFQLYQQLQEWDVNATADESFRQLNRPTLIIVNPGDTLIDAQQIPHLIRQKKLSQWQLFTLPHLPREDVPLAPAHLIVDEQVLGAKKWKKMLQEMKKFLRG